MDWKNRFKRVFKTRLIIAGFILALVGWFLLGVLLFGRFFEEELLQIEKTVQSSTFQWGLRVLILLVLVIMTRKNEWLSRAWQKRSVRHSLYAIFGIGFIGWLAGIIDLIV